MRPRDAKATARWRFVFPILLGLAILFSIADRVGAQNTPSSPAGLAKEVRRQLTVIRAQLIEAARRTQDHEAVVTGAARRLENLEIRHNARTTELGSTEMRLSRLAMALQRLARRPPEAALTAPQSPLDSARAMLLVRHLLPSVKNQTDGIRAELAELARLRHDIRTERQRYLAASQALEAQRDRLDALIEEKNGIWRRANEGSLISGRQFAQLADSADSLRNLLAALRRHGSIQDQATTRLSSLMTAASAGVIAPDKPAPPPAGGPAAGEVDQRSAVKDDLTGRPSTQSAVTTPGSGRPVTAVPRARSIRAGKGLLTFPVAGRVIERFGAPDALGLTSKGVTLETRPRAQVVATYDGKVIYAGPFRGYGRIIIIEHGDGFHTLLVGLGRIDVQTGQGLLAGEPVGVMSGSEASARNDTRRLYVELRQDGAPVDPLAWLSAQRDATKQ